MHSANGKRLTRAPRVNCASPVDEVDEMIVGLHCAPTILLAQKCLSTISALSLCCVRYVVDLQICNIVR